MSNSQEQDDLGQVRANLGQSRAQDSLRELIEDLVPAHRQDDFKAAVEKEKREAVQKKLRVIAQHNYAYDLGTYDYDGIAEEVLAELSEQKGKENE